MRLGVYDEGMVGLEFAQGRPVFAGKEVHRWMQVVGTAEALHFCCKGERLPPAVGMGAACILAVDR